MGYRLWVTGYRLPVTGYGLWVIGERKIPPKWTGFFCNLKPAELTTVALMKFLYEPRFESRIEAPTLKPRIKAPTLKPRIKASTLKPRLETGLASAFHEANIFSTIDHYLFAEIATLLHYYFGSTTLCTRANTSAQHCGNQKYHTN